MSTERSGVLIVGAGELGQAVINSVVSHPSRNGIPVSLLLRQGTITSQDPAKQTQVSQYRNLGINLVPGDVVSDSVENLVSTFRSFHTIIVCTGMWLPRGTQRRIAQMVLAAETPRFFPWQFGLDFEAIGHGSAQDLFDEQLEVRALLRAQQKSDWTIFSTGMFLDYLFDKDFNIVDRTNSVVHALNDWTTEVTVTSVVDIGRIVADVLWCPDETTSGVVYVAGETISYGRLADEVERAEGRKVERERWSLELLQERLEKDPGNHLKKYYCVFAGGRGVAWPIEQTINYKRGITCETVKDYLRRH